MNKNIIKKWIYIASVFALCLTVVTTGCSQQRMNLEDNVTYFGYQLVSESLYTAKNRFYFINRNGEVVKEEDLTTPGDITYFNYYPEEEKVLMYAVGGLVALNTSDMTMKHVEKDYLVTSAIAYQGKIYAILNIPTKRLGNAKFKVICYEENNKTELLTLDGSGLDISVDEANIYINVCDNNTDITTIYKFSLDKNQLTPIYNQHGIFSKIGKQVYLVTKNEYINLKTLETKSLKIQKTGDYYLNEIDGNLVNVNFDPYEESCKYVYGERTETFEKCAGFNMYSKEDGLFQIDGDFYEVNLRKFTKTKTKINNENLYGTSTVKIKP